MSEFRGVSLQAELVEEVEELMKSVRHYRSIAEFVSEAVRLRLLELKNRKEASQT